MAAVPQVIIATGMEMCNYIILLLQINLNLKLLERISIHHNRNSFQNFIKISFPV
jgi:hypothetical protein